MNISLLSESGTKHPITRSITISAEMKWSTPNSNGDNNQTKLLELE